MIAIVFFSLLFSQLARAASSGAKACDALGLCSEASSRAHFDTELNEDGCKLIFTSEETRNRDCGTGSVRDPNVSMPGRDHTQANCTKACLDSPTCNYVTWRVDRGECRLYDTCEGTGRGGYERYMKYCPDIPYICPYGMHKVAAPIRSDDYFVGSADFGESGSSEYIPGELMDIHVRSLNPAKKFLGILIYAVQNDGIIGEDGCPSPGCDGKEEIKVGEWEATDIENFQVSCDGKAMTHTNAKVKKFHHVFRWRAPPSGSGDVIFRVIVKTGSTNGGWFYWPMESGDLMLFEGVEQPSAKEWVQGNIGMTCEEVCHARNQVCDRSVILDGSLDLYEDIKTDQSCQLPLLSKNTVSAPSRDADGFCYFQNSALNDAPSTDICDAGSGAENEFESERLCPCIIDLSASRAPTADRPTNAPTLMTTVEATPAVEDFPSVNPSSASLSETYAIDWTAGFGNVPAQSMEAEIGDSLIFNDVGGHNIYLMPTKAAFDDCDFSSATLLSNNNGYMHTLTSLPMYFACRVGSHCRAGQKLSVTSSASTAIPSLMPTEMPTVLTTIEATSASLVWELIASTSQGDNGCSGGRIANSNADTVEVCQMRCSEAGATFMQFHATGYCGCFATCSLTRRASAYNSPADVYQLKAQRSSTQIPTMLPTMPPSKSPETSAPTETPESISTTQTPTMLPTMLPSKSPTTSIPTKSPESVSTEAPTTLSKVWNLIASTSQGDNGCAAQRISDSNAGTVELCKSRCFEAGASFLQFHSTGFCGCFDACPLNRDASRYNSPADVYQLESQISSSMPTKAPTMLSNGPSLDDFGTGVLVDEVSQGSPTPSPSPIRRLLLTSAEDSEVSFISEWHLMLLGIAAAIVVLACCLILYIDILGCYKRNKQDQVVIDLVESMEVGGQKLSPSFSTQYFCIRSKVPSPSMKVLNEAWNS